MTNQPGRVMIADDEPHVRQFLHELLSSEGYEVGVFATGADLLEAVPTFHPDVIVVDMMMPGLSGTDVLAALRRADLTVPVILISGRPIAEPEGFFAFIKKPFNLPRVIEAVTAAVDRGRTFGA
jgi:FixJ family two-component response regulator